MSFIPKFILAVSSAQKAKKIAADFLETIGNKIECLLCPGEEAAVIKDPSRFDGILVIGGDGYMLRSMHNYYHLKLPFVGINAGTVGFLMNEKVHLESLIKINDLPKIKLKPLSMEVVSGRNNTKQKMIAFNDVSVYRATNQAAKLSVSINNKPQLNELIADGIIVATPAGSSAYNFSAGGSIVPIDSNLICITPVCPSRPRGWKGAIIPHDSIVDINILENQKRPVNVVADFHEIGEIKSVKIKQKHGIYALLTFTSESSVKDRMIKEQFMI
ncbi:MAG: NAD kinase [Rickettsiaceae bacterium]|nr:NAD kinase [Rickettsiaceae bacterium]